MEGESQVLNHLQVWILFAPEIELALVTNRDDGARVQSDLNLRLEFFYLFLLSHNIIMGWRMPNSGLKKGQFR